MGWVGVSNLITMAANRLVEPLSHSASVPSLPGSQFVRLSFASTQAEPCGTSGLPSTMDTPS